MVARMKSSNVLNWGILGTGMIAGRFAADLPFSRSARLAAVASRRADSAAAFAKQHGGVPVTGYEKLLPPLTLTRSISACQTRCITNGLSPRSVPGNTSSAKSRWP